MKQMPDAGTGEGMFDRPDSWQVGGLCICGPFLTLVGGSFQNGESVLL